MRFAGALVLVALVVPACTAAPDDRPAPASAAATATTPAAAPTSRAASPARTLAARGPIADAYARLRAGPGAVGMVVRDRVTGATWRNAAADRPFRAASTVKVAIAVDLLTRARAGEIRLDVRDRADLRAMLVRSDNAATSRLWGRFGGAAIGARFPAYGLTGATGTGRWGSVRCSPADLERLVTHVLDRLDPADRATLTGLMRAVDPDQRWGVLGVTNDLRPGGKNGWTTSSTGWALDSAGFVGPGERWTVAVMTDLPGSFETGTSTVTGTVITLFLGLDGATTAGS